MSMIAPFLWFDGKAQEAMEFYVSIFPNSKVLSSSPMSVAFELDGQKILGLNGGPQFHFTEAFSFFVECETQEEIDGYWEKLLARGGVPSRCGWLKDQFGLSWQIIPKQLGSMLENADREKANRAMQAMLGMQKIDIASMKKAFNGEG